MIKLIKILTLTGLFFSNHASACDEISEAELITIKNELVLDVLNGLEISIENTSINFSDDFLISRHPRTGCGNVNIFGTLVIQKGECTITSTYSTNSDAQENAVKYTCN